MNAALVAERLLERLTERERDVLDRVVLVDVQITRALDGELEAPVLAELLEHVIEEAEPRLRARVRFEIEIDVDADIRFARLALNARDPGPIDERVRDRGPGLGARGAELEARDAEVARELDVGSRCRRPSRSVSRSSGAALTNSRTSPIAGLAARRNDPPAGEGRRSVPRNSTPCDANSAAMYWSMRS